MYNFTLTKDEEKVAQFIVLEAITEHYWSIKFKPKKVWTDLLLEFAVYSEKSQKKITTKYRNILEKKFKNIIPKDGNVIEISRIDSKTFLIETDTEKYTLKIFLENSYLVIEKNKKEH